MNTGEGRTYSPAYAAYEQKAAYQRNMLAALFCVIFMALLLAALIRALQPGPAGISGEDTTRLVVLQQLPLGGGASSIRGRWGEGGGDRLGVDAHSPDFVSNLRILADAGSVFVSASSQVVIGQDIGEYSPEMPDEQPSIEGDVDLGTDMTDVDYGLGEDKPFLPGPRVSWSGSPGIKLPRECPAIVFARLNPRYIKHPADTGYLLVDLTIDKRGHAMWNILEETPEHEGFGRAYDDLLLRSRFFAGSRSGEKVDTHLQIEVTICLTCAAHVEVVSGNVLVGTKDQ